MNERLRVLAAMSAIDFPSYLLAWRERHKLNEKDAAAILAVSAVAIYIWQKPGFEPPVAQQAKLIERMLAFEHRKE